MLFMAVLHLETAESSDLAEAVMGFFLPRTDLTRARPGF
jgi:hypothetical protein